MKKIYKKEIQRLMPLFRAIAEGKTIQWNDMGVWRDIDGDDEGFFLDTFVGETDGYRIKPEPKYRPFANAEECWNEMEKHKPFGWLDNKKDRSHSLITHIKTAKEGIYINGIGNYFFNEIMEKFTFADGTPFGIKLEE